MFENVELCLLCLLAVVFMASYELILKPCVKLVATDVVIFAAKMRDAIVRSIVEFIIEELRRLSPDSGVQHKEASH